MQTNLQGQEGDQWLPGDGEGQCRDKGVREITKEETLGSDGCVYFLDCVMVS